VPATSSAALAVSGGTPVSAKPVPFMSLALTEGDVDAALAVLKSGMLRQAAKCAELELRFGEMSHAAHALTCANGTCALQLAYGALLEPGDDVLVPAWTYIATVSMVVAAGCRPIFVDADPETFQICPKDLARKVTPRTTAIAATHLYGMPVDIAGVQNVAKKHGLKVIYDAAQAHLATYSGKGIGAFGDAVTYSFYATKNLSTGEGGLVTTNDPSVAKKMGLLRSHGETEKYLHEMVGFNYRMNDITAALGCSRLSRLADQTAARQRNAERYDAMLARIPGLVAPGRTEGADAVWHLYTVRMDPSQFRVTRDEFCKALNAEGVPTAVHYPRPLTRQPAFDRFSGAAVREGVPVAESLSAKVFCLPMHHDLSDDHFRIVEEALEKVAGAYRA
jgi:perosamine synthetase